jgi:uncharacterized cupin superfamily protein
MSVYLIRSDEIAGMEGTRKVHFRNPNARRLNKSLGDAAGLTGFGFHLIEVEPGHETTEHHLHHHEDECVFVLSGTATAYIGDDACALAPGDFVGYRKGGLAHSIKNTGTELLRCIVVGERRAHDVCDYPRQNKRMYRNQEMPLNLVDLSAIEVPSGNVGKK